MARNARFRHSRHQLHDDLVRLGVRPGMTLMVHASCRAIGPVHGGPNQVHLAIEDAVGPDGTIMMAVDCSDGYDDVGRGIYSAEQEAEILEHQPAFDAHADHAAREIGALAEYFRCFPGTISSEYPAGRMAARGARAQWLTADPPWDYCYGRSSALERLCQIGGRVLLLGSDHDTVTLLHYAEHTGDFPDKVISRYMVPMVENGQRVWRACEEVDSTSAAHANWPDHFFAIIVDDFIKKHCGTDSCATGKVGHAQSELIDAATLIEHAKAMMVARAIQPPEKM